MKAIIISLLALTAASAFGQANSEDNSGSLFPTHFKNPLYDRTARNVGDILTVVVVESVSSNLNASTAATKKDSNKVTAPFISSLKIPLLKTIIGDLSTGADSSVSGTGTTSNSSSLTARIAVVVKSIDANGNLIVE